jgi:hypothetical protein
MSQLTELLDQLTMLVGADSREAPEVTRLRARAEEFLDALLALDQETRAELEQAFEEAMEDDA